MNLRLLCRSFASSMIASRACREYVLHALPSRQINAVEAIDVTFP